MIGRCFSLRNRRPIERPSSPGSIRSRITSQHCSVQGIDPLHSHLQPHQHHILFRKISFQQFPEFRFIIDYQQSLFQTYSIQLPAIFFALIQFRNNFKTLCYR